MKTYTVDFNVKCFAVFSVLVVWTIAFYEFFFIPAGDQYGFVYNAHPLVARFCEALVLVIFPVIPLMAFAIKCSPDEEKMVFTFGDSQFLKIREDIVYWKDICRIGTMSFLFGPTDTQLFIYTSHVSSAKLAMSIPVGAMPLELLNDILKNTPSAAMVQLDSAIKRKYIKNYGTRLLEKFGQDLKPSFGFNIYQLMGVLVLMFFVVSGPSAYMIMRADALISQGRGYANQGNFDRAISFCSQALKINPGYPKAYLYRGLAYEKEGKYPEALADFNHGLEKSSIYEGDIYAGRGGAYYHLNNIQQAVSDCHKAVDIYPNVVKTDQFQWNCRSLDVKGF